MTGKTETPAQIAEAQAKRVYKAMTWGAEATLPKSIIPKWVEGGNSLAQVEARAVVQAIMEMQPAPAVAENARLRKALEPFAIALHIAQQALGSADVGHIEAVALRYVNHAHMAAAQEAMAEGET